MSNFSPYIINAAMITSKEDLKSYNSMQRIVGNSGNTYITYGLIKWLYGKITKVNSIDYWCMTEQELNEKIEEINASSHVFLVLQDLIRPQEMELGIKYKKLHQFLEKIKVPIIVPNIGANCKIGDKDIHKRLSADMVRCLHSIAEHTNYIGVRGAFTQEVLSKININNTIITGCPTYFENGRNRIIVKHEHITKDDIVYYYPFSMSNIQGHSILQGDLENNIIKALIDDGQYITNECHNLDIINAYINKKYHFFTNIENWKAYLKNFKVTAGMRMHGSIIAINSGLSPIVFIRDLRIKEMVEYFKLPYFYPKDVSKNILDLYEQCDYSEANRIYNQLYDNWVDFLHKNNCLAYYENPEIKKAEEFIQPDNIQLYSKMIDKNDIMINLLNNQDKKINEIQQQLQAFNQKITIYENKQQKRKEKIEKIFSVKNATDGKHKVWCVLGVKIKIKKRAQIRAGVERE